MRILVANKFFHPRGGAERVFFQERAWLAAHGHEVADFAMADEANLPSPWAGHFAPNRDYHAGHGPRALADALAFVHSPGAARRAAALARAFEPQVAHLHNIYHQLTPAIIPALRRAGARVALTLHDYKPFCPAYTMLAPGAEPCRRCLGGRWSNCAARGCGGSAARSLLLWAEAAWHSLRRSYDAVDLFLAPSRFMAETALAHGIAPERVRVLHNGIDAEAFAPTGRDEGYALFMGRLSREKGLETLCDAAAILGGGARVRIAGDGPLRDALAARGAPVEMLGRVEGEALARLVDGAAFVVAPSLWYENCSMSVLEAMAMAKPVVAADMGGLPEQVLDGETGLLVPPGDAPALARAMGTLLADPALRRAMGRAGAARLRERYDARAHCEELERIYEELAARGRGGAS